MADTHAVNQAAVNHGSLTVAFAAAAFAASCTVSADITYNWKSYSDLSAVSALLENQAYQTHNTSGSNSAACVFYSDNVVYRPIAADTSATATFTALGAPSPGGALFDAGASVSAELTYKHRTAAAFSADALQADNDDTWAQRFVSSHMVAAPTGFVVEPGVLLSGETDYTWDATCALPATASIAYGTVRIQADGWFPFAGAVVDADITTKFRTGAAFNLGTAIGIFSGVQTHVATVAGTASASVVADATRTAYVEADLPATATTGFYSIALKISEAAFPATGVFSADGTRIVFHGYPVLSGEATLVAEGKQFISGGSALFSSSDVSFSAEVNLVVQDVVTFIRPAEQRIFVRSYEQRIFTRSPS